MATAQTKLRAPEDVVDVATRDKTFWSERDLRMKDTQDLVEQAGINEVADDADAEDITVRSSDGATIVRKLSAMVGANAPNLNLVTAPTLKDIAERSEDLIRAARFEMELQHAQGARAPLAYDEAQSIFLRGWLAGRLLLNDENPQEFLWDYTLFDPMQVYPRYSRKSLYRVSTITESTVGEVIGDWGKDAEKLYRDEKDDVKVKLYGFYDTEQMAIATDKGWLKKPTKHGYGFVPWVIVLGPGAFYRATANDTATFTRYVGQGILDVVRDQIRNNEKVLTMLHQMVAREAEPPVVIYTNASGEPIEMDLRSGARNVLAATDKVQLLNVGPNIADLKTLSGAYQEMIFRGTVPPILFGDNAANLTGFLANVLQGSARDLIFPYLRALETFYTLLYRRMLQLFAQFGVDMEVVSRDRTGRQVGGIRINKLEVAQLGAPRLYVQYRDVTPKDEAAKAQMAIGLVRDKLVSMETAREKYLGLDNPIEEQTKVLSDLAYLDPTVVKFASAMALQKQAENANINLTDLLQVVQQLQAAAGGAPPQGVPGQNGVPANNAGLPPEAVPPQLAAAAGLAPGQQALGPQASGAPTPQNLQLPLQ